jgi:hypothetical protein
MSAAKVEILVDCPKCGTHGFTPRGLRAHVCNGVNRNPSPSRDRSTTLAKAGTGRIDPEQTIATREFSKNAPVALVDLTLPQLAEAYDGLSRLEKEYENMSGICATLKGLVLIECKTKPELKRHFKKWVIETFPKSYKTATRYMRLAEAFGKSDSTGTFQTLTRDLAASVEALKEFQLDLSHPAVAAVAKWVNGRGAYQLMLDFPGERGGDTSKSRAKKLSAEEKHELFLKNSREDFAAAWSRVDALVNSGNWKAPSIKDAEIEDTIELAQRYVKEARAWINTAKKSRTRS